MRTLPYLILLVALLFSAPSFAQRKVALEIAYAGTDPLGAAIAAELREAIRTSTGPVALVEGSAESIEHHHMRLTRELSRPRIRLQLLTAEVEPGTHAAVFANVIYDSPDVVLGGAHIRSMVETCARNDAASCAQRLLVRTGSAMRWLRDHWPSLWKTL